MGSHVSDYIPSPKQEKEAFLIKGLRLPLHDSVNCLSQLIGSYFFARENFLVFTSPFGGKAAALREILESLGNFVVFSNDPEFPSGVAFSPSLLDGRSFAIFYNVPIPFKHIDTTKVHVCGFYDYELDPSTDHRDFVAEFTAGFPSSFQYTTVCREPNKKKVEFLFGTNPSIKHICMDQISNGPVLAFSRAPVSFKMNNVKFVYELDGTSRARQFVFYDLESQLVSKVLRRFDNVAFIYTREDFLILHDIVEVLEECGLAVPEHIKRLSKGGAENEAAAI